MNEEEYFEQLCSNSVDGTLTDSEKQKLEEHLAECPSCAALKEDLKQMHRMLAEAETAPPARSEAAGGASAAVHRPRGVERNPRRARLRTPAGTLFYRTDEGHTDILLIFVCSENRAKRYE